MSDNLKLLRYNTGTDKKVLIKFKDSFSAIIFNATIVAYSKSAVADLVAVHKNQYIIDPQTHIFQQDIKDVQTENASGNIVVKRSVDQYLSELPSELKSKFYSNNGNLSPNDIKDSVDELIKSVYSFETCYVDKYIKNKEYDKYLKYANIGPSPAVVIAPYFMLKSSYSEKEIDAWMALNALCAQKLLLLNKEKYKTGIQIVIDKRILDNNTFANKIKECYKNSIVNYAFIWVDDFNLFKATKTQQEQFKSILIALTELGIKPVMAYGGYDSIILCNEDLPYRMYGVAQSVGYGETRPVTPVGGGLPVNKYYFPPLHARLSLSEVTSILSSKGYFSKDKAVASEDFYQHICSCKQCRAIIGKNIDNFRKYNESSDYTMRNGIRRNRPTTDASLIAAMHFMFSKVDEWNDVESKNFDMLKNDLLKGYSEYCPALSNHMQDWCSIYG